MRSCANESLAFTDWSTEIVLEKELSPIRKDLLIIRDDLNRLSYIGLHLEEPKTNDERDELDLSIKDSMTNIRQYLSALE